MIRMAFHHRLLSLTCASVLIVCAWNSMVAGEDNQKLTPEAKIQVQSALEAFNGLIGGWRGAAQPVRGSNKGAWTEKAEWVWEIKKDSAAILYHVKDGKALTEARLTYDPESKLFHIQANLADKTTRDYSGKLDGNKVVLNSMADSDGFVHRITITQLNEKRTLVLLEKRPAAGDRFSRVVEVGYTREGTTLAVEGAGQPECIVSGGKGTMQVSYKGKNYWVCCSGCRDAFNDDPEGVLAEAATRAEKKKQKKE
jgi:YHS domain-containing protein